MSSVKQNVHNTNKYVIECHGALSATYFRANSCGPKYTITNIKILRNCVKNIGMYAYILFYKILVLRYLLGLPT